MPMPPNSPIVNAGVLYVNGLTLESNAPKIMIMRPGQARDSSNVNDIVLSSTVLISGLQVGAVNGVDQSALVANAMYAVYAIGSSTSVFTPNSDLGGGPSGPAAPVNPFPVGGLLSLASNAAPFLPIGYDMYRRVGWVATDSASNLVNFWQYGSSSSRMYYWDVGVSVLSAGTATGSGFSAVALNSNLSPGAGVAGVAVPPKAVDVLFDVSMSAAATVQFKPFGSTAAVGQVRFEAGNAAINSLKVPSQLNAGVPTIQYGLSAGTVSLLVTGFVDAL